MKSRHCKVALWATLWLPVVAHAHPGVHGGGFLGGAAHPLMGADHLLVMLAVGLWAAQQGGRSLWGVPLAFVGMMALGAMVGVSGLALPAVETGIGVSVLVSGLLVACAARLPLAAGMALAGSFALFHGYAHGTEMPMTDAPVFYAAGMLVVTGMIHACGAFTGLVARVWLARLAGAGIATAGVWLVI